MVKNTHSSGDIAIVGMAGRFPGAKNSQEFWHNLEQAVESIRVLSDEDLLAAGVTRREFEHPDYVRACPVLDDIKKFDAAFFGMSPREASIMDPTHRFFLEVAWEALEHSGNTGLHDEGSVGVFAGAGGPFYLMNNVRTNATVMAEVGEFLARHTGNDMNFLATRVSYELDLRGPSMNVQTACSSALVAVHQARLSLLRSECDLALAGGSTINVPMGQGYQYHDGEILSPDGHCRPFDHRSAGTVFGSGTGCIVLKRLADALDNGDTIYAVLKGSAINNDGALKVGYLAPGVERQVDVIGAALDESQVPADSISYVETHGTGTSVGDPIELMALSEAFSKRSNKTQFCGVGSVKSNIGHLGEAAATASLIKVIQCFQHKKLVPTLGFEKPNPRLELDNSPLYVVDRVRPWVSEGPLRAGITALGAGGTNCHVILEEPPAPLAGEGEREVQLLVMSARTRSALDRICSNLADELEKNDLNLADVAYTLALGRRPLTYRRVLTARNRDEAIFLLRNPESLRVSTSLASSGDVRLALSFPGGGAQYAGMAKDLYAEEEVFRDSVNECFETIDEVLETDLRSLLFASPENLDEATLKLQRASLSLPALFSVEYGLARLFESWGLTADAYVGHSMGEYVAACLAGVFSVRDAIRLVVTRGKLFETTPSGSMLALSISEQAAQLIMPKGLSIAAVNAPELCVVSGPRALIESFRVELSTNEDVDFTPIHIDVAAHSSLLEGILDDFRAFCRTVEFHPPERPVTSNLSGGWLTAEQATDPEYWVQHLRNTVRFSDCAEAVLKNGATTFLEIGPGRTLTTLVRAQQTSVSQAVNSIRHVKEDANDLDFALFTLGKAWASGVVVDWSALYETQLRNRIALPTYPFEGGEFWISPQYVKPTSPLGLIKRDDIGEWFYAPSWVPCPSTGLKEVAKTWLVVSDDGESGERIQSELMDLGAKRVIRIQLGTRLRRRSETDWIVDPMKLAHFKTVMEVLDRDGLLPDKIAYVYGLDLPRSKGKRLKSTAISMLGMGELGGTALDVQGKEEDLLADEQAYFGIVHLVRVLADVQERSDMCIMTTRAFRIGTEPIRPSRRLSTAPALVVPHELPEIEARFVDVESPLKNSDWRGLAHELIREEESRVLVLRKNGRFRRTFSPLRLKEISEPSTPALKSHSIVVMAGGLGGIALSVAKHWAKTRSSLRFALLTRKQFPTRAEWPELLKDAATSQLIRSQIAAFLEIESFGSRVMVVTCDVCDLASTGQAAREIRDRFGTIDMVVHAAGVFEDGPFQTKSDHQILKVLAPKVLGTRNLEVTMGDEAKLFLLFSSIASFLGLPGQIDYTAANAFLDATAEARSSESTRWISVGWNAWRDVGMIADRLSTGGVPPAPAGACNHPFLGGYEANATGHRLSVDLSVQEHWLLGEHRIVGGAHLIPGTGYVELIRAAFERSTGNTKVELKNVTFLSPFQVAPDERRRLEIHLIRGEEGFDISLRSFPGSVEHVLAQACFLEGEPPASLDVDGVKLRCLESLKLREGGFLQQEFVDFGPRWGNLLSIASGEGETLVHLELIAQFSGDLPTCGFHPALMDMATGAAQHLLPGFRQGEDFFVPLAYETIRIYSPLTSQCFSHIRLDRKSQGEIAIFDVSVVDPMGRALVEIGGFTMKRVRGDAGIVQDVPSQEASQDGPLEELIREAILPEEGVCALDRIMAQEQLSHVVASSVDVNLWSRILDQPAARATDSELELTFDRPDLGVEYVAPEGSLERGLAELWSKLLGIENPGVNDEFFALGGDSLVAVRLFSRIKKLWGIALPISILFQAPTIRALGVILTERGATVEEEADNSGRAVTEFVPFRSLRVGGETPRRTNPQHGIFKRHLTVVESASSPPEYLGGGRTWLIFLDDAGVGEYLLQSFTESGDRVITVRAGDSYHKASASVYTVAPERGREEMQRLISDLKESATIPSDVVHLWLLTRDTSFRPGSSFFHRTQEQGFSSLLGFFQALADKEFDAPLRVTCVTNWVHSIGNSPLEGDGKATSLGPLEIAGYELPRVQTRHVDVELLPLPLTKTLSLSMQSAGSGVHPMCQKIGAQLVQVLAGTWDEAPIHLDGGLIRRVEFTEVELPGSGISALPSHPLCLVIGELSSNLIVAMQQLASESGFEFVWIRPARSGGQELDERLVGELRVGGINLEMLDCDLTHREQLRELFRGLAARERDLCSLIVGLPTADRELMQLLDDGGAEDLLAMEVLATSLITELARIQFPEAVVCFVAGLNAVREGGVLERAGSAFLERHVPRCREAGQRVSAVFCSIHVGMEERSRAAAIIRGVCSGASSPPSSWVFSAAPAQRPSPVWGETSENGSTQADQVEIDPEVERVFLTAVGSVRKGSPPAPLGRLDVARLLTHLKKHFELEEPIRQLLTYATPSLFSRFLRERVSSGTVAGHHFKHLVSMHAGEPGSGTPFFLVAGMFGNILNLRHLGRLLGVRRPVYGVQALGLFAEDAPHETIEEMAQAYLEEILRKQPEGPIALGGFSGGGLAAFEMARRLRLVGRAVSSLIMLDTPYPRLPQIGWKDRLTVQRIRFEQQGLAYAAEWLRNRTDWEIHKLKSRFDPGGGAYEEGSFQSDAVQQAFVRAAERYEVAYYPGTLALYRPALDKSYEVAPGRYLDRDREVVRPDQGWTNYVQELRVHEVPGDHDHMVLEPEVRVLADLMNRELAEGDRAILVCT